MPLTIRNISSQQILVPRTPQGRHLPASPEHPVKILFEHPEDILIWCPRDASILRPEDVSAWRPGDVPNQPPRDVPWKMFSGHPSEDLQKSSEGRRGVVCWMSLTFILLFSPNLFDWSNLPKRSTKFKGVFWNQSNLYDRTFCEIT